MRRIFLISLIFLIFLSAVVVIVSVRNKKTVLKEEEVSVAATIFPLYDIVKNISCPDEKECLVSVRLLLPSGASPHTFELSPKTVSDFADTKVLFTIGYGLDDWILGVKDTWAGLSICQVDQDIKLIKEEGEDEDGEEEKSGVNPHYWLSIANAEIISRNVNDCLIQAFPSHKSVLDGNFIQYVDALKKSKRIIEENFQNLNTRSLITFHDAFPYFANEFGLHILASFEPFHGKEPTPRELAGLREIIAKNNVTAIFTEPQISGDSARVLAEDLKFPVYELDPEGSPQTQSYIELMIRNSEVLKQALGR